jgi:hypothetical protein
MEEIKKQFVNHFSLKDAKKLEKAHWGKEFSFFYQNFFYASLYECIVSYSSER